IGAGPLAQRLTTRAFGSSTSVTIWEPDRRRSGSLRAVLPQTASVAVIAPDAEVKPASFDMIVAANSLRSLPASVSLDGLCRSVAPGGMLIAIEPQRSYFCDVLNGLDPAALGTGQSTWPGHEAEWEQRLVQAGFAFASACVIRCGGELAT